MILSGKLTGRVSRLSDHQFNFVQHLEYSNGRSRVRCQNIISICPCYGGSRVGVGRATTRRGGDDVARAHGEHTDAARARARAIDDERRDVRSAGVADWKTSRRGNTERTLTPACRRAPLLATPIATPLQGGRPERPGPFVS